MRIRSRKKSEFRSHERNHFLTIYLPAQILDLRTKVWLTVELQDRLRIRKVCNMNIREQGCCFNTIMVTHFSIILNISKVWSKFRWTKNVTYQAITSCSESTNSPCVTPTKGINQKAVIDVCSPLSGKFQTYFFHYSTIIPIIDLLYSLFHKMKLRFWSAFTAGTSSFGRSRSSTSSLVVMNDQCALPRGGCGGRCMPCMIGGLDVSQPTSAHGWTKTYRSKFGQIGRSRHHT
jgi:hypothetical protein